MTPATTSESQAALDELRREILRLVTPILAGAGIGADATACRLVPGRARLDVHFDLPTAVPRAVERALAVRVLDAVRGAGRTYGAVHATVHTPA
jgi:hypothetical protein